MPADHATERLRISPRSAVVAVALLGLTLAVLRLIAASARVIGWVLAAAAIAGLLHPLVSALTRHMRRGLAILVVALLTLSCVGIITYGLVNGLVRSTHRLQEAAPALAARLEERGRFHKALHDAHFAERTRRFVKQVPQRLQGRTPAEAVRAATTRGVAFLATFILTLFFLIYGDGLTTAGIDQIRDPLRRERWRRVSIAAGARAFGYARGSIAMSGLAGLLAYATCSQLHVPGAAPLGLWVALWDLVPIVGAFLGALPIVLLAGASSMRHAVLIGVIFLVYQLFETLLVQPWVERRTLHVGPFATVAGFAIGLELYGIGGAVLLVLVVTLAIAVADELAPL